MHALHGALTDVPSRLLHVMTPLMATPWTQVETRSAAGSETCTPTWLTYETLFAVPRTTAASE